MGEAIKKVEKAAKEEKAEKAAGKEPNKGLAKETPKETAKEDETESPTPISKESRNKMQDRLESLSKMYEARKRPKSSGQTDDEELDDD